MMVFGQSNPVRFARRCEYIHHNSHRFYHLVIQYYTQITKESKSQFLRFTIVINYKF